MSEPQPDTLAPWEHQLEPPPLPAPYFDDGTCRVYQGDSIALLRAMPTASVDACITDPPYSSGGLMRSDRNLKTSSKYVLQGTLRELPEFHGDNRDQRSFLAWSALWMAEAYRIVRPGGFLLTFTDWRQIPITADAIQAGGWIWKGLVVWDKVHTRPVMGMFRSQCEFIAVASHGSIGMEQEREHKVTPAGLYRHKVNPNEKQHITGKPLALMQDLLKILPPGSTVLDPFAGSGTTLLAAKLQGHKAVGIEMAVPYCKVIRDRVAQQVLPM